MWSKKNIKFKRRIGILVLSVLFVILFLWRYQVVNAACPPPTLKAYALNEPVEHNGVIYTLSDYKVLSEDDFCAQYGIEPLLVKVPGLKSKIVLLTMYAQNPTAQNIDVDFAGQMLMQYGNYQCSYMCYIPLFQLLNQDKPTAGTMLPGHDITLTVPYQVAQYPWNEAQYNGLESESTQIVFSLYPTKKIIKLN